MRGRRAALAAAAILLATPAFAAAPAGRAEAPSPWTVKVPCERGKVGARDYSLCLYEAVRASEQALEAELANAFAVIAAREDLAPVQRSKWHDLLEEAQSRFLLYRTFDCQSVAPFEGPRGIGDFAARALCLVEANTRRGRDLRARYGEVPKPAQGPAFTGPEPREGSWTHAAAPPAD